MFKLENLHCKCETLDSNPSLTKKGEREGGRREGGKKEGMKRRILMPVTVTDINTALLTIQPPRSTPDQVPPQPRCSRSTSLLLFLQKGRFQPLLK
jgi:hypothetical protein